MIERTVSGLHASLVNHLPTDLGRDKPILDVGCGTGAWLARLAGCGFVKLYGLDLDVRQFASPQAHVIQSNLDKENPDLGDARFGLITAIEVIEHLENPGHLLDLVGRYLADDGYFLMTTPNVQSLICRFRFFVTGHLKQFDHKGDSTHLFPVLLTMLRRVLPRYELEIVRQWSFPEDGSSMTSRRSLKLANDLLRMFFRDPVPGDILCLLIQKRIT